MNTEEDADNQVYRKEKLRKQSNILSLSKRKHTEFRQKRQPGALRNQRTPIHEWITQSAGKTLMEILKVLSLRFTQKMVNDCCRSMNLQIRNNTMRVGHIFSEKMRYL